MVVTGVLCLVVGQVRGQESADTLAVQWLQFQEGVARAQKADKPIFLMVGAPWCGPCARLKSETYPDPLVARAMRAFVPVELTIDDWDRKQRIGPYRLTEAAWSERLGAAETPTLLVLTSDLQVLGRHTGFLPPEGLLPILNAAARAASNHDDS